MSRKRHVGLLLALAVLKFCGGSIGVAGDVKANTPPGASPFFINLADYAKGDGTDETDAIQRAVDALPKAGGKYMGGQLYVPRPPVAYCISKTINVVDKWNSAIICETPVWGSRGLRAEHYFRWIGPDNDIMFNFNKCKGMRIENLSLNGMDYKGQDRMIEASREWESLLTPLGRHTRGVTGILLGPENRQVGFQNDMIFDQLAISDVAVGIKLGDWPSSGPDITRLLFHACQVMHFSHVGIWARSGNLANVTFQSLTTYASNGAQCAIRVDGGELLLLNYNGSAAGGEDSDKREAEILLNAGGIHVIKAWSEWGAPFLKTGPTPPQWGENYGGTVNFPVILEGVRHYGGWGGGAIERDEDPIPYSVIYNRPIPLHLIGCSFWGGVQLGAECWAPVIDYGTVFINKHCRGFTGEGITKHHRLIQIGTPHPRSVRVLEPYFVDRRHVPGIEPPAEGVWQQGDGIINIEPDPSVPEKACRGWTCIEAGEPGRWMAYGPLITSGPEPAGK